MTKSSRERVRHHFIVQNIFVRGLNAVCASLFAPEGAGLRRLEQRDGRGKRPEGDVVPAALARYLDATPIPWDTIRALYVLSSGD